MKFCPKCHHRGTTRACPHDGFPMLADGPVDENSGPDLVGRLIDGKYEVQGLIGTGSMGAVWLARHRVVGQMVALKVIQSPAGQPRKSAQRFLREAQASARLSHPNTIRVYDCGTTEDGLLYMTMELLKGRDLRALIREEGPLPPLRAVRIGIQVCEALDEAHQAGIVHRDIKPSNVFLAAVHRKEDFVKVIDFGISHVNDDDTSGSLTEAGHMVGTPRYMPPEQAMGGMTEARGDLYSFGIILYEMLKGTTPFECTNTAGLILAHVRQPPPPLPPCVNGVSIPDALRQLLDRLLAKEPSLRPDSAARVAVALQAIEAQLATCPEAAAHTGALGSPGEPPLGEKVRPFAGAPDSSDQFGAGSPIFSEIAAEADRARRRSRRQTIAVGIVALLCAAGIGISVWAFMSIETPTEPPPGVVAAGDEPSRAARGEGAAEKDVARAPLTPAEPVSVAAVPAPAAEPGERQGASPPASGAAPDAGTSPVADAAAEAVVEPEDAGSRSEPDPGAPAAEAASPVLLDSKPPGAAVLVGGKRIGSTPMTLSVGQGEPLKVLLLRSGHYPANVELTRSPARRLIRLRPRDVHIEVP